jgi:flagellar secretion chaperone FliS
MNPHLRYQENTAHSWARIDMLLLVYDKLVGALQDGVRCLETAKLSNLRTARFEVQRCITVIADGLDLNQGEVPRNIVRLCLFTVERTTGEVLEDWKASLSVMQSVREGFSQIQDEARELEHTGKIPALNLTGT